MSEGSLRERKRASPSSALPAQYPNNNNNNLTKTSPNGIHSVVTDEEKVSGLFRAVNFLTRSWSSTRAVILIGFCVNILIFALVAWNSLTIQEIAKYYSEIESDAASKAFSSDLHVPRVWVMGRNMERGYLNNVLQVFHKIGFQTVNGSEGEDWDILWAHDYPFLQEPMSNFTRNLKRHQRVNHFPGSGFITNKVNLAKSDLKGIPKAFNLPDEKEEFLTHHKENPSKLWVQKSSSHRGIKVDRVESLDLTAENTFIQEYIQNPLLIDGKKFDIGVYVTLTSVDPLRVYVYEADALLRFCADEYYEADENGNKVLFNASNVNSYVVADEYTPTWEIPSLKKYFVQRKFNMKNTLNAYLAENGKDFIQMWKAIDDSIRSVYISKEPYLSKLTSTYPSSRHFFELVRFDFLIDEDLNVYLMEANMSPNLSSLHFAPNRLLYHQVLYNMFSMLGLTKITHQHQWAELDPARWDMMVAEHDLSIMGESECLSDECDACGPQECVACYRCLQDDMKFILKDAYLEHLSRWNNKRLLPSTSDDQFIAYGDRNHLQLRWFVGKCLLDDSFCI